MPAMNLDQLDNEYRKHLRGHIRPFFYAKQGKRKTELGRRVCDVTPAEWLKSVSDAQKKIIPRGNTWFNLLGLDAQRDYQ